MKTCICKNQSYGNRKPLNDYKADSDGIWLEGNELNIVISYEESSVKINYCPWCGRELSKVGEVNAI